MSIHSVVVTGKSGFFIGVALCVAAISAPAAMAAIDDTTLVSRVSAGALGDAGSTDASVSADGRYVAFASDADNLSGDDNDGFTNVFLRDTLDGDTTLVSRASDPDGPGGPLPDGAGGDALSFNPAISADGRYVAFASDADNLGPSSPAALVNVFVRDTVAATTTLVSRADGAGGAGGDDLSNFPSISADGRYVAFASDANNLVPPIDGLSVFVRDTQTNDTSAVSLASDEAAADDVSAFPSISATGRYVAFQSFANNLAVGENEGVRNVFVRDRLAGGTTTLVSRAQDGLGADATSSDASISADGRYVAFESEATNLAPGNNNGALVGDAFVRDLLLDTTTMVSRQSAGDGGAGGDGASGDATLPGDGPAISDDGRYVAYQSLSDNLSGADNDAVSDVFFRDTQANTTTLVSRATGAEGTAGNGASFLAAISASGRYVVFDSSADNLVTGDGNGFTDIFQRDVLGAAPPPDTDPPETIYAGGPAEGETVPEGSVTFQFVSDEPGSTFEALLTGWPDWQTVTSPLTVNDLTAGNYTFQVRAIDPSGNVDPSPTTRTFIVAEEGGPPPPPPGGDEDPPELRLSADGKQKLGKAIKVDVSCDEACSVAADGTVKAKGKRKQGKRARTLELKELRTELPASRTVTLKLAGSDKVKRKLKKAKKGTASITVTASDDADNSSERSLKVKLR